MRTNEFLSTQEVGELFGVSASTVTRWAREEKLPYIVTPGGRRRFPRREVEALATYGLYAEASFEPEQLGGEES